MNKAEAIKRIIAKQEEARFNGISEKQVKILCDIATVMDLQGVYKKHNSSIAYVAGYTRTNAAKQALAGLESRGLIIRLYNQPNPKCVIRCLYFTEPFAEMIREEMKADGNNDRHDDSVYDKPNQTDRSDTWA